MTSFAMRSNLRLQALYTKWRADFRKQGWDDAQLWPPLLLDCPDSYTTSKFRILYLGQETGGWAWDADLRQRNPRYPVDYPFDDIWTFADFLENCDSIEALMWGYKHFSFAAHQPRTARSPFWQTFRRVAEWEGTCQIWSNVCRAARKADGESCSFLELPQDIQCRFLAAQAPLFRAELNILKPDMCMFLTGPRYDGVLESLFPGCRFKAATDDMTTRQFARVSHPLLPAKSFRTYHPNYLFRARLLRPVMDGMKRLAL